MEYINRIELKGRVGTVRSNVVNGSKVVNFSLITDILYKTREGNAVSESTWFNIAAWEGKDIHDMDLIQKGAAVHVSGRIRSTKFAGSDGTDRQFYEVMASRLRVVDEDSQTMP